MEELKEIVASKGGIILDEYINCRAKITFQCKNGHTWKSQPRKIKEGSWCPICSMNQNRKYNLDFNFFSKDTEYSFYWAGFIAADGWVRSDSKSGYVLGLELSIKDIEHLKKFKEDIQAEQLIKTFEKPERYISNNKKTPISKICSLLICSKQIVNNLKRFGIIPNKTYKLNIPDWLKEHDLLHHFLRGYIDGDGCFSVAKNKNQKPHITFCMRGTANFLNSFNDIMYKKNIIKKRKELIGTCGKQSNTFARIQYSGNNKIFKMYNYLYDDCSVCLDRKKQIAKKSKKLIIYKVK